MSTNHQLPLVSAALKPANNSTSLDEVVEALKRIEVPQVLFRLSRWENLEHAKEI